MSDSEALGALLTLAEIGIGIVGFAGLVLAVTRRQSKMSRNESYQLRELVRAGLGAVALALVPVGALLLGAGGPQLWRWASGVHTLMIAGAFAMVVYEFRGAEEDERDRTTARITYLLGTVGILIQAGNALGWPFHTSAGIYFLGVLVPLAAAALFFTRLLFSRLF